VRETGLTNVRFFPLGVTDSSGVAELFEASGNTGDHRLYPSEDEERPALPATTVALDELALREPPVDFVKLDVQGVEEAAMRGIERLLDASPEATIALEFWPAGIARSGGDAGATLAYYRGRGYVLRAHRVGRDGPVEVDDAQILALCSDTDGAAHTDLALSRT